MEKVKMEFTSYLETLSLACLGVTYVDPTYQVQKLSLELISAKTVLNFIKESQGRSQNQQRRKKIWFENQLRIFMWVLFKFCEYSSKKINQFNISDWALLGSYFGKSGLICEYFSKCYQRRNKSQWREQEDDIISSLMRKNKQKNKWTDIGKELFFRSHGAYFKKPKQIRERWNNYLNPSLDKSEWNNQQDFCLFQHVLKKGKRWAAISKLMKSRSEHSVKNRFMLLIKRCKGRAFNEVKSSSQKKLIDIVYKQLQQKLAEKPQAKNTAEQRQSQVAPLNISECKHVSEKELSDMDVQQHLALEVSSSGEAGYRLSLCEGMQDACIPDFIDVGIGLETYNGFFD